MFGNKKQGKDKGISSSGTITSIIDKEMAIVGDVSFKGKTRLDGKIEGNVSGDYLIISNSGIIRGDIDAKVVVCQGRVEGNIRADKIHAQHEAVLHGGIESADLAVESGAKLIGEIKAPSSKDLRLVDGAVEAQVVNE